jgi:hypothetical protein
MAMSSPCDGCGNITSYIFAAQYRNGDKAHAIICSGCWDEGKRCWFTSDGDLVVAKDQPDNSRAAALYWDEGGMVTGGDIAVTYPDTYQPTTDTPSP